MKNIKNYYMIYIPGIIISMATTFAILGYMSVVEYALINMYTVYSNYMPILTFGFQDGIFLKYRKQAIEKNSKRIKNELTFMIFFQIIVFIIAITVAINTGNIFLIYATFGMLPINLLSVVRNILQSANKINQIAIIDLIMRVGMLLAFILVFTFKLNASAFIFIDIFIKSSILLILLFYVYGMLNKCKVSDQVSSNETFVKGVINNFKNGFSLLIGSWLLVVIYSMDKIFLSEHLNQEALGNYAAAMTIISLFITVLVPLRTIFLTTVEKSVEKIKITDISSLFNYIAILIASVYLLFLHPFIQHFGLFSKYSIAFDMILYIVLLLPFIMNLQIQLTNLMIIKHHKLFPFLNIFVTIIFFLVYKFLMINTNQDVYIIIFGSIINYAFMYIIYIYLVGDKKANIRNIIYIFAWIILYISVTINLMFLLPYFIFLIVYTISEFRRKHIYLNLLGR